VEGNKFGGRDLRARHDRPKGTATANGGNMSSVARKVQNVLGLSSADEIDQAVEKKVAQAARPGAQAPTNLGESVIHAAADVALSLIHI
jgi:hypothetical protein